jgi:hypothetical protein
MVVLNNYGIRNSDIYKKDLYNTIIPEHSSCFINSYIKVL